MNALVSILGHRTEPGIIRTISGQWIDLHNLQPEHIHLEDIAHALSMQCRYNGHVPKFYSVAEHSVAVAEMLPNELKLWGLLHDAAEAYLGDIISPLKMDMPDFHKLEDKVLSVIAKRFDLPWPIDPRVFKADKDVLKMEMDSFALVHTMNVPIYFHSPEKAMRCFLDTAKRLMADEPAMVAA